MPENQKRECCCSCPAEAREADRSASAQESRRWVAGSVATAVGDIPVTSTNLDGADRLGGWRARWAIGRMNYRVEPGLYAVGSPSPESDVFVSANYKMSFDRLRSALAGIDGWILVLDTKGVNVWCAAGKGTFGTDELVHRIEAADLAKVVSHRRLIVPQLGAPGIAAHEVRKRCGFQVVYGPVRAHDISQFLKNGMEATPEMRRVRFPLADRVAVVPVELVMSAKYVLAIMAALLLLAGLGPQGYSWARAAEIGIGSAALFGSTFLIGTILAPVLLPWLPGRALSLKGTWIGLVLLILGAIVLSTIGGRPLSWLGIAAWCLIIPVTTSFAALNFSGATTYTSLSGVRREMRIAVPLQAAAAILGALLWIAGRFT